MRGIKYSGLILAVVLSILGLSSCSRGSAVDGPDSAVPGYAPPQINSGTLAFYSGSVELLRKDTGDWIPAELGDELSAGDAVRTGSDSHCEIQFPGIALIVLQENTSLSLDRLITDVNRERQVSVGLDTGTVLSKVRKLSGTDSFEVTTASITCGVRGTEFLVRADAESSTLAVGEGRVQLIPAADRLIRIRQELELPEASSLLVEFEREFPVFEAGREITVDMEAITRIESLLDEVAADLIEAERQGATALDEGIRTGRNRILAVLEETSGPLTEESEAELDSLEERDLLSESADTENETESEAVPAVPRYPASIVVEPADARFMVNSAALVSGSFGGYFPEGTVLRVSARRSGYEDGQAEYVVSSDSDNRFLLNLTRKPATAVSIEVEPAAARIYRDDILLGEGSASDTLLPEESSRYRVELEGYNSVRLEASWNEGGSAELATTLLPTVAAEYAVSSAKIVGTAGGAGRRFYSDADGALIATDAVGRKVWTAVTANSPNSASVPVLTGDALFFSGIYELLIFDAADGDLRVSRNLDPGEAHNFGRRIVPVGEYGLYPANDELKGIDPASGDSLFSISVPGGSRMRPLIRGDEIYIVNQDGVLLRYNTDGVETGRLDTGTEQPIALTITRVGNRGYFADKRGRVVAVDLDRLRLLWKVRLDEERSVPVYHDLQVDGAYLYAYSRGVLYRLAAADGDPAGAPLEGFSAPPLIRGGFLYGGSEEAGRIVVREAVSGRIVTEVALADDERVSAPVRQINGRIAVGTGAGRVIELNPQDGSLLE